MLKGTPYALEHGPINDNEVTSPKQSKSFNLGGFEEFKLEPTPTPTNITPTNIGHIKF